MQRNSQQKNTLKTISNQDLEKIKREDENVVIGDEYKPSTEQNYHWIYARSNTKYDRNLIGKWLIFVSENNVDHYWEIIKKNTENNNLGVAAKVSTAKEDGFFYKKNRRVICVYTYDFRNSENVMAIREKLSNLGFTMPLCYKTDDSTLLGRYGCDSHLHCKMVNGQKSSSKKTNLNTNWRNSQGEASTNQFVESGNSKLKKLDYSSKKLTDLDLSSFSNLKEINCRRNNFKDLNWLTTLPHPEQVVKLDISNNPSLSGTLEPLNKFRNLVELDLSGGLLTANNLSGSLAPLASLRELKVLNISRTKLNGDIEYLPINLEVIRAKNMAEIEAKLKGFEKISELGGYDYQAWKKVNQELIQVSQIEQLPK